MKILSVVAAFGSVGCDEDIVDRRTVGVGRIWAYSSPTRGSVVAEYRGLGPVIPTCLGPKQASDNCVFDNCLYSPGDLPPTEAAGDIAVHIEDTEVVLEELDDGTYRTDREDGALFEAGDEMKFTISGAGEIGKGNATLYAPPRVTVTQPPLGQTDPLALDRAQDFEVEWEPVSSGNVLVAIRVEQSFPEEDEQRNISLACRFEGWRGSGKLEADLLGELPQVGADAPATFWVGTETATKSRGKRWEHWYGVSTYDSTPVTLD